MRRISWAQYTQKAGDGQKNGRKKNRGEPPSGKAAKVVPRPCREPGSPASFARARALLLLQDGHPGLGRLLDHVAGGNRIHGARPHVAGEEIDRLLAAALEEDVLRMQVVADA